MHDRKKEELDKDLASKVNLYQEAFANLSLYVNSISEADLAESENAFIEVFRIREIIKDMDDTIRDLAAGNVEVSLEDFCIYARMCLDDIHRAFDFYDDAVIESDPILENFLDRIDDIIGNVNVQDPVQDLAEGDLFWSKQDKKFNRKLNR